MQIVSDSPRSMLATRALALCSFFLTRWLFLPLRRGVRFADRLFAFDRAELSCNLSRALFHSSNRRINLNKREGKLEPMQRNVSKHQKNVQEEVK